MLESATSKTREPVKQKEIRDNSEEKTPSGILILNGLLALFMVYLFSRLLVVKGLFCTKDAAFIGAAILTAGVFLFNRHEMKRRKS